MKKFLQYLMVVMSGAGVARGPGALRSLARPNAGFDGHDHDLGHGHGRDKDRRDRGSWHEGHGREHWDNGRHRGWYRERDGRYRFDNDGRRAFVAYVRDHHDERWFHERGPRVVAFRLGFVVAPR